MKAPIPSSISSLPPEGVLPTLLKLNNVVVVGEDHTDHAAKRLLRETMPILRQMKTSLAWEMVRSDNTEEKEDLRPDQTMVDRYIFQGDNKEQLRTAITKYCHDYGGNMVEEKMALLHAARENRVRIIGIDKSCPDDWHRRIGNANPHWESVIRQHQKQGIGNIVMLVGKYHIHNINLYDEGAGDQATGIDQLLGAPSLVVHTSTSQTPQLWQSSAGSPTADVELRLPADYFLTSRGLGHGFAMKIILESIQQQMQKSPERH